MIVRASTITTIVAARGAIEHAVADASGWQPACNCWKCLFNDLRAVHGELEAGRPDVAKELLESLIAKRVRSPRELAKLVRGEVKCARQP